MVIVYTSRSFRFLAAQIFHRCDGLVRALNTIVGVTPNIFHGGIRGVAGRDGLWIVRGVERACGRQPITQRIRRGRPILAGVLPLFEQR